MAKLTLVYVVQSLPNRDHIYGVFRKKSDAENEQKRRSGPFGINATIVESTLT